MLDHGIQIQWSQQSTVASLYGVIFDFDMGQANLRYYNTLDHWIQIQWSPCMAFPKHSGLPVLRYSTKQIACKGRI